MAYRKKVYMYADAEGKRVAEFKRVLLKNKAGEGERDLQGGGGAGDRTVQTYIRKISRNMRYFRGFNREMRTRK